MPARPSNFQVEIVAKRLCREAGLDPDEKSWHAYGDDFTAWDWERKWTSNTAISAEPVLSPNWRLYRARAAQEIVRFDQPVRYDDTVVPFRRPK
jgi:hypothetical protein